MLVSLIKIDNEASFPHYVQGFLARLAGDETRAGRAFRMAARLDPADTDAQRMARLYGKPKS